MTLSRQLVSIIVALFIIGLLGTLGISVNNTRRYLVEQLESHAQDTASSLGLSLSPHMAHNDLATIDTMVNAIFDRGYYQIIRIRRIDGSILLERSNPLRIEGVPAWFVSLIPLPTPEGEALVMSGWRQAATVQVRSHPGYAYAQLWRNSLETLWLFGAAALGTLLLGLLMLRVVLRPLRTVEEQAEAICARDYRTQTLLPRTRELRRVVEAMNRLTLKVKAMFDEQAQATEQLREQTYKDPVTGLGNRRYFDAQLQHLVEAPEEAGMAAVLLVQLHDFKAFNEQHGYEAGDALLRSAAGLLGECCAPLPQWSAARLTGADFAVLVAQTTVADAERLGAAIAQALLSLRSAEATTAPGHVGIAMVAPGQSTAALLAAADMALRAAQTRGVQAWYRYDAAELEREEVRGAAEWQALLREAVRNDTLRLHVQPVLAAYDPERVLHREILLRLPAASGALLSAAVFMPMAERFGLARDLDRLMLAQVFAWLTAHGGDTLSHAVNLAPASLRDSSFVDWLCARLEQQPALAGRLIFEVPEYGVLADVAAMRRFTERVTKLGARCAIDHFGRGFASFGYLGSIKVHTLKIDGSFIRAVHEDPDKSFFVQALIRTAHSIDIEVIAECVEHAAEWALLRELHVDGVQGYLPGAPAEL